MKKWLHEHPRWPEYVWDSETINPLVRDIRKNIQDWQEQLETKKTLRMIQGYQNYEYEDMFTRAAIKTSKIEGIVLNESEVRDSIEHRLKSGERKLNNEEIDGLVDMIMDANLNYDLPLTEERLKYWHKNMFPNNRSGLRPISAGEYRRDGISIVSEGNSSMGAGIGDRIHYEAPVADRVPGEMEAFADFVENAKLDWIVKAGVAHLRYEQIHPFQDGNGRIGRAIIDLLLARAADSDMPFHIMSSQIEKERDKKYYKQLEKHGFVSTVREPMDITDWLVWFLECLLRSVDEAKDIVASAENRLRIIMVSQRFNLNQRQQRVIREMTQRGWVGKMTNKKYMGIGKTNSSRTATNDMKDLEKKGLFIADGKGRSTSYRLLDWDSVVEWNRRDKERIGSGFSCKYANGETDKINLNKGKGKLGGVKPEGNAGSTVFEDE